MFKKKDTVCIVSCSDGMLPENQGKIEELKKVFYRMGLQVLESPYLYRKDALAASPARRGEYLMSCYENEQVKAIFDVSGGNLANQILEFLDFETIKKSGVQFWGYSDLTVVLNALYTKAGKSSWLYQVRNLVGRDGEDQRRRFQGEREQFLPDDWKLLAGSRMEGILVGGNIRCFLKLAGTQYFPDLEGKLLFLESFGGSEGVIASLLTQLKQMGAFDKIGGLLLGTFTELDEKEGREKIEELVLSLRGERKFPVARTSQVGHGADSRGLPIGSIYKV